MKVTATNELDVTFFKVEEFNDGSLREENVFDYLRSVGYEVYHDYSFYLRKFKKVKGKDNYSLSKKYQQNQRKSGMIEYLLDIDENIIHLFRKYRNGEPDLLVEKDGEWRFVEIKTTSDSLKPNQLEFINELQKLHKTSLWFFLDYKELIPQTGVEIKKRRKESTYVEIPSYSPKGPTHFERAIAKAKKTQLKRGYKEFWIVVELYRMYLDNILTITHLEAINKITGIKKGSIINFIKQNEKSLAKDAYKKLSRKNTLSAKDRRKLDQYKKIFA